MHLSETVNTGFYFLAPGLVLVPILGLLINAIFGKNFSEKVVGTVASLASGTAFVISVLLAYSVAVNHGHAVSVPFAEWIHIGDLKLDWTFRVDSLSATMMLVVPSRQYWSRPSGRMIEPLPMLSLCSSAPSIM